MASVPREKQYSESCFRHIENEEDLDSAADVRLVVAQVAGSHRSWLQTISTHRYLHLSRSSVRCQWTVGILMIIVKVSAVTIIGHFRLSEVSGTPLPRDAYLRKTVTDKTFTIDVEDGCTQSDYIIQ